MKTPFNSLGGFIAPASMAGHLIRSQESDAVEIQPTAIGYAIAVLGDARSLATQVEDIVAQIIGQVPSSAGTKDEGHPDGAFPWLEQQSRVTQSRLIEARDALLRLERAI